MPDRADSKPLWFLFPSVAHDCNSPAGSALSCVLWWRECIVICQHRHVRYGAVRQRCSLPGQLVFDLKSKRWRNFWTWFMAAQILGMFADSLHLSFLWFYTRPLLFLPSAVSIMTELSLVASSIPSFLRWQPPTEGSSTSSLSSSSSSSSWFGYLAVSSHLSILFRIGGLVLIAFRVRLFRQFSSSSVPSAFLRLEVHFYLISLFFNSLSF